MGYTPGCGTQIRVLSNNYRQTCAQEEDDRQLKLASSHASRSVDTLAV